MLHLKIKSAKSTHVLKYTRSVFRFIIEVSLANYKNNNTYTLLTI